MSAGEPFFDLPRQRRAGGEGEPHGDRGVLGESIAQFLQHIGQGGCREYRHGSLVRVAARAGRLSVDHNNKAREAIILFMSMNSVEFRWETGWSLN